MQTSPRLWTPSAVETRERPFVSFIVPVLNAEKDIGHCLQSIQNLEYDAGDYEVLIMDNGSTDRTHRIIRNLGLDFHVIPQVHVSALRNRGAARARGDYKRGRRTPEPPVLNARRVLRTHTSRVNFPAPLR